MLDVRLQLSLLPENIPSHEDEPWIAALPHGFPCYGSTMLWCLDCEVGERRPWRGKDPVFCFVCGELMVSLGSMQQSAIRLGMIDPPAWMTPQQVDALID